MTLFVTVAIAWAADDRVSEARSPNSLRWTETAALAGVFGALQWAVLQLLLATTASLERAESLRASTPRMLATAIVIGACIGWFVRISTGHRAAAAPASEPYCLQAAAPDLAAALCTTA